MREQIQILGWEVSLIRRCQMIGGALGHFWSKSINLWPFIPIRHILPEFKTFRPKVTEGNISGLVWFGWLGFEADVGWDSSNPRPVSLSHCHLSPHAGHWPPCNPI